MVSKRFLLLLLLSFCSLSAQRPKIAVLSFLPQSEMAQRKIHSLTTILNNKLNQIEAFEVLPTLVVAHFQEELGRSLKTTNTYTIALELGKRQNIDWIILPSLVLEEGYSSLNILLMEGKQGTLAQKYVREGNDQIPNLISNLEQLTQQISAHILNQNPLSNHNTPARTPVPVEITDHLLHADRYLQTGNMAEALNHMNQAFQKGSQYPSVLESCLAFYLKTKEHSRAFETLELLRKLPEIQGNPEHIERLMCVYENLGYGIPAAEMMSGWLSHPQTASHPKRAMMLAKQEHLQVLAKSHEQFFQLAKAYQEKNSSKAWGLFDCIKKETPQHPWLSNWQNKLNKNLPRLKKFYQRYLIAKNSTSEDLYVYVYYAKTVNGKAFWVPTNNKKPFWWLVKKGQKLKLLDKERRIFGTHQVLIWAESVRKNAYGYPVLKIEKNRNTPIFLVKKGGYLAAGLKEFTYTFKN